MSGTPGSSPLGETFELPVIAWRLVPGASDDLDAELDLAVTLRRGEEPLVEQMVISASEMRLPPSIRAVAEATGVLGARLPDWVAGQLSGALSAIPSEEPVWLEIGTPAGHLAAVPWEHMLRDVVGDRPILRLPSSVVRPVISKSNLDVAVCAVTGRDDAPYDLAAQTRTVVRAMASCFPADTRIHVFARSPKLVDDVPAGAHVIAHRPESAAELEPEEAASIGDHPTGVPGRLENPWLRWMLETASSVPLDVVHFICPGHLSSSYGALDFGPAPLQKVEEASTRLGTAGQLMAFLTRAGAWGTAFSIPSSKAWPAGMRILAHRISQLRPGPLLVHAPHHSRGDRHRELVAAYRALFTEEKPDLPRSRAFSLYIHPSRVRDSAGMGPESPLGLLAARQTEELTLVGTPSEDMLVNGTAPAWLAANQRNLERWATSALEASLTSLSGRESVEQGANDALAFISTLLGESAEEDKQ